MKSVLVLGAGLVAGPPIRYLLDRANVAVTVANRHPEQGKAQIGGRPNGKAVECDATDTARVSKLVAEHDLTISLLPAPQHPAVAKLCLQHGKHMVTTSYVSPAMAELNEPATKAGLMFLNEIGVDPGIDHMSAMRIIHGVARRGGKIVSFRSYCGGLPAPDANTNPWGYKFSWSPRGVLTAAKNGARYLKDGTEVNIPSADLFTDMHTVKLEGLGEFEAYPNRDSLKYTGIYGLEDVRTMYRGTFRNKGWCATWKKIVDLGLLDETPRPWPAGTTYAQFMQSFLQAPATGNLRADLARQLNLDPKSHVLDWWDWLGLLGNDPLPMREASPLDVMCARLHQKCTYAPGERDMIAMHHEFIAEYPGKPAERITSTLIDYGIPGGDSSMSRTVGLPAAIATKLILEGHMEGEGVHVPVRPYIYEPVLNELEELGIRFTERTTPMT